MSRKDYIAIAAQIATQVGEAIIADISPSERIIRIETLHQLTDRLCRTFASTNPRFDAARFASACGFRNASNITLAAH